MGGGLTHGGCLVSILEEAPKSSSESGRDLDREASSDRFESDLSPGAARVEVA
jgi:hypothetical protein